ncbi:MAG: response regulator transcription factor [Limnochordales bacterium]|nr:response regulator transcription factor [Limnochordales bacterium]
MLSKRQEEVAKLLVKGKSTKEIAAALRLSPSTCLHHIRRLCAKVGAANRIECEAKLGALGFYRE